VRLVFDLLRGRARATRFARSTSVDVRAARGESLGVIGENGAGKSTLLKIVAGVIEPTRGASRRTAASARCSSSARASIPNTRARPTSTSAARCSAPPSEIARKRDEIIASRTSASTSTIRSSTIRRDGRAARLRVATALARHLITDEVLAVGDESFQKKCIAWIEEYLKTGGTLLCARTACTTSRSCAASRYGCAKAALNANGRFRPT
jgi:lipopolysaccharide transport system ATP-binding protein